MARSAEQEEPASPQAADGLPQPRRLWAIAALSFGIAVMVIDGNIANVALPTIARELGVSAGAVTNVVTVYQLVMVMGLLPFANYGDRIGHRRLYVWGQALFLAASALCFFVDGFATLLGLRAIQATGAGMALSVSAAMIRDIYPEKSLGSGLGFNSVVVASSAAVAPTLGGFITANGDWRLVFVAAAPLALVSLLLARSLPNSEPRPGHSDLAGGIWSAITVAALIGGVQVSVHGGTLAPGLALFAAGIGSAVLLVRRERRRERPVVPVDLMAMPVIGLTALAAVAGFSATASLLISLPFLLEQEFGYAPDEVGLILLPFPLALMFASPVAGWLSDRVAPTKLGVAGLAVAAAALVLLAFMPATTGVFGIGWRLALCALGFGFFLAPNSRLLIGSAPRDRSAAAGGLLSSSRLFGQTTAAALVGILLSLGLGLGPAPLLMSAGFTVLAAGCSLTRFRTVRAQRLAQDAGI